MFGGARVRVRHLLLLPLDGEVGLQRPHDFGARALGDPLAVLQPTDGPSTDARAPGELLLYPGGVSEAEVLVPYGATLFASRVGQLAGNHFATVIDGRRQLAELGRLVGWEGAQDVLIEELPDPTTTG